MRFDLEDSDGSWWSLELGDSSGVSSRETIQRTKMFGFDQVTAISQGSINSQFSTTSHTAFHTWSYDNYFTTTYKPFSLHLLSNNRALVWVHLANGNLKTLRNWVPWDEYVQAFDFEEPVLTCYAQERSLRVPRLADCLRSRHQDVLAGRT